MIEQPQMAELDTSNEYPITLKVWTEKDRWNLVFKLQALLYEHGAKFRLRDKNARGGKVYKSKGR